MNQRNKLLSAGDGVISRVVRVNREPVKGVRLRLALNDSVLSQRGITDANGRYVIPVPYGKYRIDGYELDMRSANKYLAGKIDYPGNPHLGAKFDVSRDKNGEGLSLDYVDPIIKKGPSGEVSLAKEIVATWQPYPEAERYVIQIYENNKLHGFVGQKQIYKWPERPTVEKPTINLTRQETPFKVDHYYTLQIRAEEIEGNVISETAGLYIQKDFKIIE